jgi:hypothetical protein
MFPSGVCTSCQAQACGGHSYCTWTCPCDHKLGSCMPCCMPRLGMRGKAPGLDIATQFHGHSSSGQVKTAGISVQPQIGQLRTSLTCIQISWQLHSDADLGLLRHAQVAAAGELHRRHMHRIIDPPASPALCTDTVSSCTKYQVALRIARCLGVLKSTFRCTMSTAHEDLMAVSSRQGVGRGDVSIGEGTHRRQAPPRGSATAARRAAAPGCWKQHRQRLAPAGASQRAAVARPLQGGCWPTGRRPAVALPQCRGCPGRPPAAAAAHTAPRSPGPNEQCCQPSCHSLARHRQARSAPKELVLDIVGYGSVSSVHLTTCKLTVHAVAGCLRCCCCCCC